MANFLINLVSFLIFLVYLPSLSVINARNNVSFSVDLIHRDSFLSPYYNPSQILSQRLQNALHRSISRTHHFKQPQLFSRKDATSTIISNNGEYLMKLSIGTPPFEVLAVADTGSDLIWVQCKPCLGCYNQRAPLFDFEKSSTYRNVSCQSSPCIGLGRSGLCTKMGCQYEYYYGDQSFTIGNLANETFTLVSDSSSGQFISIPVGIFGCGHNNNGSFNEGGSGVIGLGGGSLSLISQLGSSISGKFSYCLVPFSVIRKASRMSFGAQAEVLGPDVASTPLVSKHPDTFYYLTLEGMTVGMTRLNYTNSSNVAVEGEKGNIIIDSGTTLTFLKSEFYYEIETAVKDVIIHLMPVVNPKLLKLCYQTDIDIGVPITVHFTGADVKLEPVNTFVRVADDLICLAFLPSTDLAIFGNIAQANFLVGYDREGGKVSFKPTDCTKP